MSRTSWMSARALTLVTLVIGFAPDLDAQERGVFEGVVIAVENEGKPVEDVTVLVGRSRFQGIVVQTDERGEVEVSDTSFGFGERIAVWFRHCEEADVEVILRPEEQEDECGTEDAGGCQCHKLGVIPWDPDEDVVIDVGGRSVNKRPRTHIRGDVGFKIDAAFWHEFEASVCEREAVVDCVADESSIMPVAFAELWFGRFIGVGVRGLYTRLEGEQTFDGDPRLPETSSVEMTIAGLGPYAAGRVAVSPILSLQLSLGALYLWNSSDISTHFPTGTVTEEREQHGTRFDIGGAVNIRVAERLHVRLNLNHVTAGDNDADAHWSVGGGILATLF